MDEKIIGYGVFENADDGEIFVGYYVESDSPYNIEEDNFYESELEATQVALGMACEKITELKAKKKK